MEHARTDPASELTELLPKPAEQAPRSAPDALARDQRARLEVGMVEAVTRHGYAGTTLRELVGLAGISKTTFYEHFESKEACFFATADGIAHRMGKQVSAAYGSGGDPRERLSLALTKIMQLAVEQPAPVSLVTVESLTLGAAGVEHRELGSGAFKRALTQSFEGSSSRVKVSTVVAGAIVGGIQGLVYRRLREGRRELLPDYVEELTDWALGYQRRDSALTGRAMRTAEQPSTVPAAAEDEDELDWKEPPDSPRSRAALSQRERIVRAAARVVFEVGYDALSIPAISGAAGVSNQTFYENFSSKREAFLEAFEILWRRAIGVAAVAVKAAPDSPEGVGAGTRAMLDHVASDELFARIAFCELPIVGTLGLDRSDAAVDEFTASLQLGDVARLDGGPPSAVVREAIASGVWATIQRELARGRSSSIAALAPEIARVAVTPFASA
jgi:AcrR family transcriptional regulator